MLYVFVATYVAVLVAELVGDKTLYTLGAVSSRYRMSAVFAGASVAFAAKTLVAVLFGEFIAALPAWLVATTSAITFFGMAFVLFRKRPSAEVDPKVADPRWPRAALAGFTAIFFSEWGDFGQITTALMVARFHLPLAVWSGATLAMVTKGAIACAIGIGLRRWLPQRALRTISASMCVVMGTLAALRVG